MTMNRTGFTVYKMKMTYADTKASADGQSASGRSLLGHCEIEARTKGDAIMAGQKAAAARWGLTRTEECLVRITFVEETPNV